MKYRLLWTMGCTALKLFGGPAVCADGSSWGWVCGTW